MKKTILLTTTLYMLMCSVVSATENGIKTDFMLWSRLTMGKVVESTLENKGSYDVPFEDEWLGTVDGGLKITRLLSPSLTGRLNLGVVVNVATVAPKGLTYEYSAKKITPALLDATLEYRHGFMKLNDTLTIEAGYFPFKYNPQSTNLGEYLFRSGTYPGWLMSGFENSIDKPKLAGVHFANVFGSKVRLRQDLIINTETDVFPYHDINFTYIATPSFGRVFDLGLGVELARLIAVDPRKTTIGLDPSYDGNDNYDPKIGYLDTTASGDTVITKYTFKGTKLMCRATLDFKELFGIGVGFLGKEDLKLYGEAAFLGVKNYKGWYNDPKERIPAMIGLNWPTNQLLSYTIIPGLMGYILEPVESNKAYKARIFGGAGVICGIGTWLLDRFFHTNSKLDVISIEIERYKSPYANAQDYIWKGDSPIPYIAGRPAGASFPYYDRDWNDSLAQTKDDIKWSIYASKKIGNYVRLSAQAACDHTPKNQYTPWPSPQSAKYTDMTTVGPDKPLFLGKTNDWYFMMRLSLYF
jgi:hypothetical protein